MTIICENFVQFAKNTDGKISEIIAEIVVDTADELPGTDEIPGKVLHQGSIAYVIKSGEIYVLAGDGKWYSSEGGI